MYSLEQLIQHYDQLTPDDATFLNTNQQVFTFEIESAGNPQHNFSTATEAGSLEALTSAQQDSYLEACTLSGDPKRKVRKN